MGEPDVAIEAIDDAVVVGVALLPGAAGEGVGKPNGAIEVVDHAVEIEIAGIGGHDGHLARRRIVEAAQRQSGRLRGGVPELAPVPQPAVKTCAQQALDSGHRIGAVCIGEDDFSALDVGAAEVENAVLGGWGQNERSGHDGRHAAITVGAVKRRLARAGLENASRGAGDVAVESDVGSVKLVLLQRVARVE